MNRIVFGGGALVLALALGGAEAQSGAKVELKPVKYAELAKVVRQHAGQVLIVNFWSTT